MHERLHSFPHKPRPRSSRMSTRGPLSGSKHSAENSSTFRVGRVTPEFCGPCEAASAWQDEVGEVAVLTFEIPSFCDLRRCGEVAMSRLRASLKHDRSLGLSVVLSGARRKLFESDAETDWRPGGGYTNTAPSSAQHINIVLGSRRLEKENVDQTSTYPVQSFDLSHLQFVLRLVLRPATPACSTP